MSRSATLIVCDMEVSGSRCGHWSRVTVTGGFHIYQKLFKRVTSRKVCETLKKIFFWCLINCDSSGGPWSSFAWYHDSDACLSPSTTLSSGVGTLAIFLISQATRVLNSKFYSSAAPRGVRVMAAYRDVRVIDRPSHQKWCNGHSSSSRCWP